MKTKLQLVEDTRIQIQNLLDQTEKLYSDLVQSLEYSDTDEWLHEYVFNLSDRDMELHPQYGKNLKERIQLLAENNFQPLSDEDDLNN